MKIGLVASVKSSHPYLENDPAPLFDLHYLRISPWLWFSCLWSKRSKEPVPATRPFWASASRAMICSASADTKMLAFRVANIHCLVPLPDLRVETIPFSMLGA